VDDDRALLERLRAGDADAFDAIFRAWYAPLVRVATRLTGAPASGEEVVQDVFLELWRRRATLDADVAVHAWLLRSTRNRALNVVRHARIVERTAPQLVAAAPHAPRTDADAGARELQDAVDAAVAALPPRCREVFALSRGEGLRYAEIAERLGVTVKAVEAQMGRALRTLRERLAEWLPPGETL
jgi:RNA polymerase sigma-70 factor (ECF subfamily)